MSTRLKKILCNRERPVQIVIAGKAHPKDQPGQDVHPRNRAAFARSRNLEAHLIFVEDYDMKVARELVQGVDLWLNTPRRGEEACGTSGMKAAMNGVLNLSVLDGWFDEAYEISGGWAIGDREHLFGRPGRHPRQQHLLPARKRNRSALLSEFRKRDSCRMDSAHENVHGEYHATIQLRAHGGGILRELYPAGSPALLEVDGRLRTAPRSAWRKPEWAEKLGSGARFVD